MRHFIFPFLLIFVFVTAATAQPPQKKTAPAKTNAKKPFVSIDGGFSAGFPGNPTKKIRVLDAAYGKAEQVSYELGTATAHFAVSYIDFPLAITDETELEVRYDLLQKGIAEKPGNKFVEHRRIYVGESLGRELVFEHSSFTSTMRVFAVKHRFFHLTVTTMGAISKASAAKRKFHADKAADFFETFSANEIPDINGAAVELPEDFGVSVKDGVFRCDFFGFNLSLPKDWTVLNAEQNEELIEIGMEEAKELKPREARQLEFSLQNTKILTSAFKLNAQTPAGFMVAAERVSFPTFVNTAAIEGFLRGGREPGEIVLKKQALIMLDGVEFAWVEVGKPSEKLRKRVFIANRKGIALQFFIEYSTAEDLEIALRALQSVKFDAVSK